MICFVGTSFAPTHLKAAAIKRGLQITDNLENASLVFVSEDTPTNEKGERDLDYIRELTLKTWDDTACPLVLTSQVPPGFTRSLQIPIYHMAETLRVTQDTEERAFAPEQIIMGCEHPNKPLPPILIDYIASFYCPLSMVSWETAECAKIVINLMLAEQVDATNRLSSWTEKQGGNWDEIRVILDRDKRIGKYTKPGNWRDSRHLLRDWVTYSKS
jgi:UDP-glucose 6-dehydrogenase